LNQQLARSLTPKPFACLHYWGVNP